MCLKYVFRHFNCFVLFVQVRYPRPVLTSWMRIGAVWWFKVGCVAMTTTGGSAVGHAPTMTLSTHNNPNGHRTINLSVNCIQASANDLAFN